MSAWCENEFKREARRLLGKMLKGARLIADGDGFALTARNGRAAAGKPKPKGELIAALRARGLIEAAESGYIVSEAGRFWLARQQDGDDPFAAQHRDIETKPVTHDGKTVHVAVNHAESPLTMLNRRGLIDADGFAAGERLRRDYTLAQMTPRMGVDFSAPCLSGRRAAKPDQFSDSVLAAKQRFAAAMRAVGPELSGLLFDLCCDLQGLEACEKSRGWPRASAKVVLNIGLRKLAGHYGIGIKAGHGRMRGWVREADPPPDAC